MDWSVVTDMASSILVMILGLLLFISIIAVVVFVAIKYKRYSEFKCVIWGADGFGQTIEKTDNAGIFVDRKTQNKRLFLKNNKVGLDPDNVPYIQSGRSKVVYLLQVGLKNFRYIRPSVNPDDFGFEVGEEDVNWAVNDYEKQKLRFSQSMLLQYLPFISLAFVSIVIMIVMVYLFNKFEVFVDVAQATKEAANAIAQANSGTVVLPS